MSFGVLSIVLSLVFGCLILALVAQLYYFLCLKKRKPHLDIEMDHGSSNYSKTTKGLFYWVCWKKTPCSIHATNNTTRSVVKEQENTSHELELGDGKDLLLLKSSIEEEGLDSELIRLHNLAGPPRFLFTITEETKEDLESEDRSRKGSRTRSLSDVMLTLDNTPFLTPLASSPLKCGLDNLDSFKHQGFNNPLFEASGESEFNRFRSSPPPKFKFLRDAEEKLYKKLMEESMRKAIESNFQKKDTEIKQYLPQFPNSGSSQVLPLASSPTTFKPLENASMVH